MQADQIELPGISVVTVALNAAKALPLTLESVIGQDYENLEVIVVDGASWDGTNTILRRYEGAVDRIEIIEDAGIYYAMNHSLAFVSKQYVIFMNAGDQFYSADAIRRMADALNGSPDIFYGNHVYVDQRLELFRRAAPFDWLASQLKQGSISGPWLDLIPAHQATFTRTDLLRQMRFDTGLRISADHEFLFRAFAAGARMQYVDEIVCHYFGGGFSVAMGEQTRLEGASVYRRFSDYPERVDRIFYAGGSPFFPQTKHTGIKLGGFLSSEMLSDEGDAERGEWIDSQGCELLAPARETHGFELSGFNALDHQRARFFEGADLVAEIDVPRDYFRLEVTFKRPIPGGSTVRVIPAQAYEVGERDPAAVAFAIRSFRFVRQGESETLGIAPGSVIRFQSSMRRDFEALLGGGWSAPEATHMWSLGPQAELWLKLAPSARRLHIAVSGNPHVPDGRQSVEMIVNGTPAGSVRIDHGGRNMLDLDCTGEVWRTGAINRLALRPSAFARPPEGSGDTRPLGFCLWHLEIE